MSSKYEECPSCIKHDTMASMNTKYGSHLHDLSTLMNHQ